MKKIIPLLFICACAITASNAQSYTDIGNNKITLAEKSIILVTSTDCGYCLINTPFFNKISAQYVGTVQFIAMYETNKKTIEKTEATFAKSGKDVVLKDWIIIPNARSHYIYMIEQETYPQILFIENGKVIERFIGTIDSVKADIEASIPNFLSQ